MIKKFEICLIFNKCYKNELLKACKKYGNYYYSQCKVEKGTCNSGIP